MDFAKSPAIQVKEPKGPTLTLLSTGILRFIAPHKCCIFLEREGKTIHHQRLQLTLLWWFGKESTLSPRYAYTHILILSLHILGLLAWDLKGTT